MNAVPCTGQLMPARPSHVRPLGRLSRRRGPQPTDNTASPDAKQSCKLTIRRANSRCVARSLPSQRTQICQRRPRGAPHEHPAEGRGSSASDNPEHPSSQARFARAYFLPWGCLCPRLTLGVYGLRPIDRKRLVLGVEHVHRLGPRVVAELLVEVTDDVPHLLRALDDFRRLAPEVAEAIAANVWTSPTLAIVRGRAAS